MRSLAENEFKATAVPEKERVGLDEEPPFDFWEYFDQLWALRALSRIV